MKKPLTGAERVKGYYIRKEGGAPAHEPTRDIKSSKTWETRNSRGHTETKPTKPPPKKSK